MLATNEHIQFGVDFAELLGSNIEYDHFEIEVTDDCNHFLISDYSFHDDSSIMTISVDIGNKIYENLILNIKYKDKLLNICPFKLKISEISSIEGNILWPLLKSSSVESHGNEQPFSNIICMVDYCPSLEEQKNKEFDHILSMIINVKPHSEITNTKYCVEDNTENMSIVGPDICTFGLEYKVAIQIDITNCYIYNLLIKLYTKFTTRMKVTQISNDVLEVLFVVNGDDNFKVEFGANNKIIPSKTIEFMFRKQHNLKNCDVNYPLVPFYVDTMNINECLNELCAIHKNNTTSCNNNDTIDNGLNGLDGSMKSLNIELLNNITCKWLKHIKPGIESLLVNGVCVFLTGKDSVDLFDGNFKLTTPKFLCNVPSNFKWCHTTQLDSNYSKLVVNSLNDMNSFIVDVFRHDNQQIFAILPNESPYSNYSMTNDPNLEPNNELLLL